jgi:short-subunit dehydrogenase
MHKYPVHPHGAVLITGTSTGIGYHAVFEVAKLNYTVFATVRGKEDLNSLVKEAKSRNLEKFVKPVIMDVTKSEEIREILEQISKFLQENNLPLVGIVNNAGISTRYPLEIQPLEVARKVLDVNFFGAVDVTQRFLPLIRKYKGRILFISSMSGIASLPGRAIYSASKRAIEGLVDSLRLEMMPFEVSVTSLLPGYVKSEISQKLPNFQDLKPEEYDLYKTYLESVKKENEKKSSNRTRARSHEFSHYRCANQSIPADPVLYGNYGGFSSVVVGVLIEAIAGSTDRLCEANEI